ncbi:MAG: ABC transporter permease [Flavobacteriales bacterium]|nr:ABC transporter permease [Flavobacteriales bacterium]
MKNKKKYNFFSLVVRVWLEEYNHIFKDKGAVLLFFVAVFIYPLLYSNAYNPELVKEVPVVVVDNSNSPLSRKLTSMLDATFEVKVSERTTDFEKAKELMNASEVYGIVVIPKNFEKSILRFEPAVVSVYADAAYMIIYKQIMTAANYGIGTLSAGIEIMRRSSQGEQLEEAYIERDPLPLETYSLYNPKGGYATYLMPAVLLLILQQTLLLGIGLVGGTLKEKGNSNYFFTLGRSYWGAFVITLGKGFAYFSIYILNVIYTEVIIFRMFDFPMRSSYFKVFVFLVPFVFAVVFMGIAISTFFKKREHALMVLLFTSIPFMFLSGFSWPVDAMPSWQVYLSELIPSTPGIKGFLAMSQRGALFSDIYNNWLHLWGLIVFFLSTGALLFKRKIKKELIIRKLEKELN